MKAMESRRLFEEEYLKFVGIEPSELDPYLEKKLRIINCHSTCEGCTESHFVRDASWTLQNIATALFFIERENPTLLGQICVGSNQFALVLCYSEQVAPLVSRLHREVFSNIGVISGIVSQSNWPERRMRGAIRKSIAETRRIWNRFDNGIRALRNAYQLNGMKFEKDMFVYGSGDHVSLSLHGHQVEAFAIGVRKKGPAFRPGTHGTLSTIRVGHLHKLGLLRVPGYSGGVALTGCQVYPGNPAPEKCYPEVLSQMGYFSSTLVDGSIQYEFTRSPLDYDKFCRTVEKNLATGPPSTEDLLEWFGSTVLDKSAVVVPGNHDCFSETYVREDRLAKVKSPPGIIVSMGDTVEFTEDCDKMGPLVLELLKEKGFVRLVESGLYRSRYGE